MARAKKPQLAKTVQDWRKKDNKIDIMFDRNGLIFYAEYEGESFKHAEASQVEKWCEEQFKSPITVEWTPVIEVYFNDSLINRRNSGKEAELRFSFDRMFIGVTRSGLRRVSHWNIDWSGSKMQIDPITRRPVYVEVPRPEDNVLRSQHMQEFRYNIVFGEDRKPVLPYSVPLEPYAQRAGGKTQTRFVAYSEELWLGLNQLKAALDKICTSISVLVVEDEGMNQISSVGEMLLGLALPAGDVASDADNVG